MSGFDSSDEEFGEADLSPFQVSWMDLSFVNCEEKLGICALPGCRFKDTVRSLENDLRCLKNYGVKDVFCLCSKGELNKYRVPWLLNELSGADINVHHYPFPDGQVPALSSLMKMLDDLHINLMNGTKSIIHCFGGLGRSCLVVACLMMFIDPTLEAEKAIEKLRDLRGPAAIQSVKQFNFLHDFREKLEAYKDEAENEGKRTISR